MLSKKVNGTRVNFGKRSALSQIHGKERAFERKENREKINMSKSFFEKKKSLKFDYIAKKKGVL